VLQIQGAETVVLAVGDVQRVALERHALRVVESSLVEGAILLFRLADPGDCDLLTGQIRNNNAVVCAVSDEHPITGGVGENLAGEEQRAVAGFLEARQLELDWLFIESLLFAMDVDEFLDGPVEDAVVPLAARMAPIVAFGVDQDQCWP